MFIRNSYKIRIHFATRLCVFRYDKQRYDEDRMYSADPSKFSSEFYFLLFLTILRFSVSLSSKSNLGGFFLRNVYNRHFIRAKERKTFFISNAFSDFFPPPSHRRKKKPGKMDKNTKIALKFKHYTFFSSCPFHQLFNVFICRHPQFLK